MALEKPTPYQLGKFIMETIEQFEEQVPKQQFVAAVGRAVMLRFMTDDNELFLSEENAARRMRDYKKRKREGSVQSK